MDGITAYQDNAVSIQSKGRLIVILYDSAIKFMKMAIIEMEKKNYQTKDLYIKKVMGIINELNMALDMDEGGEIASKLRKRYIFMRNQLSEANIKCDPQMVRDVIKLTEELNKIWKTITW
jgi:flagellar protein FliS